jgi:tetrahydromethanopterin S-methyltransferase subunit A
LYKNGIDEDHKIIGSSSPHPILAVTKKQVSKFQRQVKIINKIGETNISSLQAIVENIKKTQ